MAKAGFFSRLKERMGKTRSNLVDNVKRVFTGGTRIGDDVFEALEEILIEADIGVETTMTIVEDMQEKARKLKLENADELYQVLKDELTLLLEPGDHDLSWTAEDGPHVTLIAGVNGSGKTTTTGKLAAQLIEQGKVVVLGAADTFRAAAAEQLTIWSERTGATIIKSGDGADPAAVAFDATDAAIARKADNLLIDTAGRLHTKVNLMEELKKIERVIQKRLPDAPHEILLILDATTGQNGLQQARQFTQAMEVTGIILTKLDGTAKGGMAIAIQKELGIPIKMIGIGEGVEDLAPFNATEFVDALFE
jgi:fused signal recognition particle receptor